MRVGCVPADLVVRGLDGEAGRAARDDDRRDLLATVALAGDRGHGDEPRDVGAGVGDELLRTVDDPLAAAPQKFQARGCPARTGIRPRLGFGQPEARESRAREQVRQQLLLLRVGAEAEDRHRAEAHARLEGDRERLVDPAERFDRETQREVVAALAAEFLGERQSEQAELPHLRDDIERKGLGAVGFVRTRRDDLVGEFADEVGELLLVVGEVVVHRGSFTGGSASAVTRARI